MQEKGAVETTPLHGGAQHSSSRARITLAAAGATFSFATLAVALLTAAAQRGLPTGGPFADHIILLPWAFIFCAPLGAITWRTMSALGYGHFAAKVVHATLMSVASLLSIVGVTQIIQAHAKNYLKEVTAWGDAHFESAHSWIGIVAFSLFFLNVVGGLLYFTTRLFSNGAKARYLPVHVFMGGVAVALVMLSVPMGIMSYAYRGNLEHGNNGTGTKPLNGIQGGFGTGLEYKLAALSIVGLIISIALVFFVSEPGWAKTQQSESKA